MQETERVDRATYDPFIFVEQEARCELLLSDHRMIEKSAIFEEVEFGNGNGYDWGSVARTLIAEELPALEGAISLDAEAGMFVAYGPRDAILSLAAAIHAAFHDDSKLRDLISRSEPD
jgi:hypothetical protein